MFGYLFKDMDMVDEYCDIQFFYNKVENAFYVVFPDYPNDSKIIIERIDNSSECFDEMSDRYLKFWKEEK